MSNQLDYICGRLKPWDNINIHKYLPEVRLNKTYRLNNTQQRDPKQILFLMRYNKNNPNN